MGTKQMTPFFPSSHSLFLIFISEFENAQNSFSCSPPFGPFLLVCKIPRFLAKSSPIQTAHHTFVESRRPEVTKNLYYVLSTCWSQISIFLGSSSWTKIYASWI